MVVVRATSCKDSAGYADLDNPVFYKSNTDTWQGVGSICYWNVDCFSSARSEVRGRQVCMVRMVTVILVRAHWIETPPHGGLRRCFLEMARRRQIRWSPRQMFSFSSQPRDSALPRSIVRTLPKLAK